MHVIESNKLLYSYLNLESTKNHRLPLIIGCELYSYLNLESTKTEVKRIKHGEVLYSYLNLESTKTPADKIVSDIGCTVT